MEINVLLGIRKNVFVLQSAVIFLWGIHTEMRGRKMKAEVKR